ncbi:hypothetical protein SVA_2944 [Sulfurifustis variabilis]|uniref:YcxB-like C-terminal domain-containing protein n=1 Tax=Sulfurifustis variabilis TaxID=1675686 RepID=A0A1B4V9Y5_9GAMM|nr:YcxB family protein [Sulfurifustis variabilis]BAU49492.1 hypothetical protein SVA_2944 [Sulfurifustis variabilis]
MTHTAKYHLDRSYLSESFDQAVRYGSKWKRVELAIGTAFIVGGLALWVYSGGELFLPWMLVLLGVIEVFSSRIKKFFWLRKQLGSKHAGSEVTLTFDDDGVRTAGRFGNSVIAWAGIERLVETPKGLLIWPQKGIYYYLPKSILDDGAVSFIRQKVYDGSLQAAG